VQVAPTKEELEKHGLGHIGLGADTSDNDENGDGMVEPSGNEGKAKGDTPTIEQGYMERG
jgi:hypothetical protein